MTDARAIYKEGFGHFVKGELDNAVERYRVERPRPRDGSGHLLALRWPSGATSYYAKEEMYKAEFLTGRLPVFAKGIFVEEIPNDGSREWKDLQARAAKGGVHVNSRLR